MFSLNNFYRILNNNLIADAPHSKSIYFYPFGTYEHRLTLPNFESVDTTNILFTTCYFFDQEPIYSSATVADAILGHGYSTHHITIIANSEKSTLKDKIIDDNRFYDWYYFFHGFVALDWYRDFQYMNSNSFNRFTKVFMCFNHLVSKYRSYRLHLVSNLINNELVSYGDVSLNLKDSNGTWLDELTDPNCQLDNRAKHAIYRALASLTTPLTVDTNSPTGDLSAQVDLAVLTNALWHIVTETVFFLPKLHLTEKVFKPIIAQRPFILVAAPGNLAYLKSYGFQTFDRWIDESYDQEQDHYLRIEKITREIARLCAMPITELQTMHNEMQTVLQFNHNHFFTTFRTIITNELVDNLGNILCKNNLSQDHLSDAKKLLLQ